MNKVVTDIINPDCMSKEIYMHGQLQQTILKTLHRYNSGKFKGLVKSVSKHIHNIQSGVQYIETITYNEDGTETKETTWLRSHT